MTNTNKHMLQTTPIPPSQTTAQCTHVYTHARINMALPDTNTRTLTRISPLLHLSLPDETNRTLIHKMEGKNALVYNHWLLNRLGGELKGKAISSVGMGLCYTQITASSGNKTTLTSLSTRQPMMDDNNNNNTAGGIYVPKNTLALNMLKKNICNTSVDEQRWLL